MVIKETRKSTTITEIIHLDDRTMFIIDRKHTVETHRQRLDVNDNHSNLRKWKELNAIHMGDLEQENLPNLINEAQAGETYILKAVIEPHKADNEKTDAFGVQNIWWEATLNYLKSKAMGYILGAIRGAIKDQIPAFVKFGVWLIEQLENLLLDQYKKINDPNTRGIIRNELNQYEQTRPLAEKMRQLDEKK